MKPARSQTPKRRAGVAIKKHRPAAKPKAKTTKAAAKPKPAAKPAKPPKLTYSGKEYEATPNGLIRWRRNAEGAEGYAPTTLTNFTARIVEDLVMDDGSGETGRAFKVEAILDRGKRTESVTIPAKEFANMNWPTEYLGYAAIVNPNCRDHARTAIQKLSNRSLERRVFRHTGWRVIDGHSVYLHNGGAIGPRGAVKGIETQLSSTLENYTLPDPPKRPELAAAVAASLRILDVAPDRITFPVFASIWRAILGEPNFAIHLSGQTQTGKSELTALAQQHFGPRMNKQRLPGSWLSTGNALEALAFECKDALLSVDDFKPVGNSAEQQRFHSLADRLLRAQGNSTGRQRLTSEIALRAGKRPRGMIFSSGEDVPKGQSLRARLVVIELGQGDMKASMLDRCQADAAAGLYAQTTAGFIKWLAPRIQQSEQLILAELTTLREAARAKSQNKLQRAPDNVYHLSAAFRIWLSFATQIKAIAKTAAQQLWDRAATAFDKAIRAQESEQSTSDPCRQYFDTLAAIVHSGRGHFVSTQGGPPYGESIPGKNPADWGWTPEGGTWKPHGEKLGWLDGAGLYLPDSAYNAVRRYSTDAGENMELPPTTLAKRLHQRRLLLATDTQRETLKVRQMCEGTRRTVLHVSPLCLYPSTEPDQPDPLETEMAEKVGFSRSGFEAVLTTADPIPTTGEQVESTTSAKKVGLVGFSRGPERQPVKGDRDRKDVSLNLRKNNPTRNVAGPTNVPGKPDHGADFTLTVAALDASFPGAGDEFIEQLAAGVAREIGEDPTDADLAGVIERVHRRDRKRQESAGLFLTTVPQYFKSHQRMSGRRKQETEHAAAHMEEQAAAGVQDEEIQSKRRAMLDALPHDTYRALFERHKKQLLDSFPALKGQANFNELHGDAIRTSIAKELEAENAKHAATT